MPRALLTLSVLPDAYAICRLDPDVPIPGWATQGAFWSVIRTNEEMSIVCPESLMPHTSARVGGWRIFKCEGPLDFTLTGIIASIAEPLANAGVSIFPLATYDTDYILVRDVQLDLAIHALNAFGHAIGSI